MVTGGLWELWVRRAAGLEQREQQGPHLRYEAGITAGPGGHSAEASGGWGHKVNELGDREKDGGCFWCLPWGLLEGEPAQRGRESRRRIYLGRQRTFLSCAGPG